MVDNNNNNVYLKCLTNKYYKRLDRFSWKLLKIVLNIYVRVSIEISGDNLISTLNVLCVFESIYFQKLNIFLEVI